EESNGSAHPGFYSTHSASTRSLASFRSFRSFTSFQGAKHNFAVGWGLPHALRSATWERATRGSLGTSGAADFTPHRENFSTRSIDGGGRGPSRGRSRFAPRVSQRRT